MNNKRRIDEVLASGRRSLRTRPKGSLLGSTGARLWADYLDTAPGFTGAVDFIHKLNIPSLFTVTSGFRFDTEPCTINWMPSHLTLDYKGANAQFSESKFITWNDSAVSCQRWQNTGEKDIVLQLRTNTKLAQEQDSERLVSGKFQSEKRGFTILTAIAVSDPRLIQGIVLKPGDTVELVIAAALGLEGTEELTELQGRAKGYTDQRIEAVLNAQKSEYQAWFDQAPMFTSNEALLNKTWDYRWFLLRHNLADPRYGQMQHPVFYEGRSHKMTKTPYAPEGWEFSKMIPLTTPMHLLENRWYNHDTYCKGVMRTMEASQDDEGLYNCLFVDDTLHSYSNFFAWSVYQTYLVHRDEAMVASMLPSIKKQVLGESKVYGTSNDKLLIEYNHKRTGKEYQPSYWYFHDYPKDCMTMEPDKYTPLKRVDRSVYHYLNTLGVARLCEVMGDPEAKDFLALAETIKQHINEKMWDETERFYYDLHPETDEKALVKNIVGFYPHWAGITELEHHEMFIDLFDPNEFNTPAPFPSVSADCPVYAPEGGWQGNFIKGRNGCVWNGPTWPYTNSIVLDALANASKRNNHAYDERFSYFLREYSWLHYDRRDFDKPYLVEHYNSQTGEAISDEVDYNHSYYIDLMIRHVVGLNVEQDRLILDPIQTGLTYFELDRITAAGRSIRVTYAQPGLKDAPYDPGLRLYVDGREVLQSDELTRLEYVL